jgi:hypothetical protein
MRVDVTGNYRFDVAGSITKDEVFERLGLNAAFLSLPRSYLLDSGVKLN